MCSTYAMEENVGHMENEFYIDTPIILENILS